MRCWAGPPLWREEAVSSGHSLAEDELFSSLEVDGVADRSIGEAGKDTDSTCEGRADTEGCWSDDSSARITIDDLPEALLAAVFLLLPADARARSSAVCSRWRYVLPV